MAAGQIIIFNCFGEAMNLSVNGTSVGTIDAWNRNPGRPLYAPAALTVPRSINPAGGQFFNGNNQLIVDWAGEVFHCNVPIDGSRDPLVESLALFVFRPGYSLLNAYGVAIASGPLAQGPAVASAWAVSPDSGPSANQGGDDGEKP